MDGAWSCYRSGHFNEGRMVILHKSKFNGWRMVILRTGGAVLRRENGHVTEVERWRENGHSTEVASLMEENGHVTEVASLMEGELLCYRGGHCKGRRIVMLQLNGGKMMLQRWPVQCREHGHVTEVELLMEG